MSKTDTKTKVVITKMSTRWNYFQIFLLGFYHLENSGDIQFKFRCNWLARLAVILPHITFLERLLNKFNRLLNKDSYNIEGYVEENGMRKYFAIDSADAPYIFDSEQLERVDKYFKMQCPKDIEPYLGFRFTDDVRIPYCDHRHKNEKLGLTEKGERKLCSNLAKNLHKIKPSVVGFRRLSFGISRKALQSGYDNYLHSATKSQSERVMCYFGNALGPKPTALMGEHPDWDWEADIMGHFGESVSHPNEKRSFVGKIIETMGKGYDARVICDNYSDIKAAKREDLEIPLGKFCDHIAKFEYNVNVSGYRMSIPNRFMESFIVGTAILTDKLAIKWYAPFDEEVVETVEMGYLPNSEVDWERFKQDLENLPTVDKQQVLYRFEEKWAPRKVAKYIIEETLK